MFKRAPLLAGEGGAEEALAEGDLLAEVLLAEVLLAEVLLAEVWAAEVLLADGLLAGAGLALVVPALAAGVFEAAALLVFFLAAAEGLLDAEGLAAAEGLAEAEGLPAADGLAALVFFATAVLGAWVFGLDFGVAMGTMLLRASRVGRRSVHDAHRAHNRRRGDHLTSPRRPIEHRSPPGRSTWRWRATSRPSVPVRL